MIWYTLPFAFRGPEPPEACRALMRRDVELEVAETEEDRQSPLGKGPGRLWRISESAAAQGLPLSMEQVADLMKVSQRTAERWNSELRRRGLHRKSPTNTTPKWLAECREANAARKKDRKRAAAAGRQARFRARRKG